MSCCSSSACHPLQGSHFVHLASCWICRMQTLSSSSTRGMNSTDLGVRNILLRTPRYRPTADAVFSAYECVTYRHIYTNIPASICDNECLEFDPNVRVLKTNPQTPVFWKFYWTSFLIKDFFLPCWVHNPNLTSCPFFLSLSLFFFTAADL